MVLKVVTGKIFKTLELRDGLLPAVPVLELRVKLDDGFASIMIRRTQHLRKRPDASSMARLSKSLDYLADNLHVFMLSKVKARVKRKVSGRWSRFQIGNFAPTLFAKDAGKGWGTRFLGGAATLLNRVGKERLGQPPLPRFSSTWGTTAVVDSVRLLASPRWILWRGSIFAESKRSL